MRIEQRVGGNIRRWRKRRGFSQEELAHRARLHPTYVSGVENGHRNPTIRVIERIAEALEIDEAVLFARARSGRASQ